MRKGHLSTRGKETRKRRPILLYVAEGDNKTEKTYLSGFIGNNHLTIVQADGNSTDPVRMMKQLKAKAKDLQLSVNNNNDRAFCLIDSDTDTAKQPQIDRAISMETALFKVIVSSPCFEEWYLCHFRRSTQYLTSDQAERKLQEYIPNYTKSSNINSELEDRTQTAIYNAEMLNRFHDEQGHRKGSIERNPSSDMYIVVKYILDK